jgi:hypothetical protein
MSRYFGPTPITFTWTLGTTIEETFEIPEEYGDITDAVPRCHIRGITPTSPLLIALGPADPPATGFVLDEGTRTLKLTISAKDSYDLTGGLNTPLMVAADIEFRFGTGDTAIVWPFGEFKATIQDRWTYFFDTDAPGGG